MGKKGKEKNTLNKAKHTKLLNRKKNKLKKEKETRKERLKTIMANHREQHKSEEDQINN
ncbi:hypothetical protein SAMN03080594_101349 [Arenibacter palladensis]|uniref:Uncharacterized protein n=1 Tax=Arenibacter palladensis TaxID=237373 RepID=A0A1M4TRJ8_9FLAO|nr:hypothetical protein [Arenibacter palladensis]SHE47038.1 hypothetical protein SAMN03080594_101349 [Arenibacter palladensis]